MRKINSLIGSPVKRVEDPRFLRGRGEFVDDLSRDGMLHAAILRSPIAHGRVRAVDGERARSMAGVHTVVTAADVIKEMGFVPTISIRLAPMPALQPYAQPVVAETKVRFVGEPLALVVAATAALAEDALAAIELDIDIGIHRLGAESLDLLHGDVTVVGGIEPPAPEPVQVHARGVLHRPEEVRWLGTLERPPPAVGRECVIEERSPENCLPKDVQRGGGLGIGVGAELKE